MKKRASMSERQKENPLRKWSPYGSTRTYFKEWTGQKRQNTTEECRRMKRRRL
jgi:hypothetical protein